MHHSNANVKGTSRGAGNAQGEDKGNNPNAACKHCQREPTMPKGRTKATTPMLCGSIAKGRQCTIAETKGGGNTTRDDEG